MGRKSRERKLRIEQGLEQPRSLAKLATNKLKSMFLESIEKSGVQEVERLIVTSKVKKDVPVDLEKELVEAKAKIGSAGTVLGVTDDDLRDVLRRVCKKCGLEVKDATK